MKSVGCKADGCCGVKGDQKAWRSLCGQCGKEERVEGMGWWMLEGILVFRNILLRVEEGTVGGGAVGAPGSEDSGLLGRGAKGLAAGKTSWLGGSRSTVGR